MGEDAHSGGSSRSNAGDGGLAGLSVGGSVTDVCASNGDRSAVVGMNVGVDFLSGARIGGDGTCADQTFCC